MGTLTFSPSLYIGMAYFFFESTFRISVFLGFSEKNGYLGGREIKMDTLLPIVYFFLFFFFFFFLGGGGGGGGLFNVKFKLFSLFFSAISNIFLKRLRFH